MLITCRDSDIGRSMRKILHAGINARKPENGFITGTWIASGWTAQPDYRKER